MFLAAISDEISQDFAHALDVLLEFDVHAVEVRALWGTNVAELERDRILHAAALVRERGMQVVGIATPFFKCDLAQAAPNGAIGNMHQATAVPRADQMALLERCAEAAHVLGTNKLRVFSFWRKHRPSSELDQMIAEAFVPALTLADREDVLLLLENEHSCMHGTGAEAAALLRVVNHRRLRAVWDPGNAFYAGETPVRAGYDAIKPWIAHVHAKDCRMVATPNHGVQPAWCTIGEGEVGWTEQVRALQDDGYNGCVSLETHYVPDGGTAEAGSRLGLASLNRLTATAEH